MGKNLRLTPHERKEIELLAKQGFKSAEIARRLGRGKNTVVVEIRRGGGYENYNAKKAQKEADKRWEIKCQNVSQRLKGTIPTPNTLTSKIQNLEFQIEILLDTIKELKNENKRL